MKNYLRKNAKTINFKQKNKNKGCLDTSNIILLAFASGFFSRLLDSAGAPSMVNFVHFALVPGAWVVALFTTKSKDRKQLAIVEQLLWGLFILLATGIVSAFWNGAGIVNVALSFLLLAEPFMLLMTIIIIPMSWEKFKRFQIWIISFLYFHLFLMYIQYGLGFCNLPGDCDNIQGVLYRSGGGHPVAASIACCFALYNFATAKSLSIWFRILIFILGFTTIQLADAKQGVIMFVGAWIIVTILNIQNIRKTLIYLTSLSIFLIVFVWAINNIEALGAFNAWIRPELYGPDGEVTKVKLSGIRYTLSYFGSPINWLVGLGPGHTVGRMGGWMIRDYGDLLEPLGVTSVPDGQFTPISQLTWAYMGQSWLAESSSLFSPFWGWAGIWGDWGFLGLGAYLYLGSIVWRKLCLDNLSKLFMLATAICGFIFTQMEEPAYMMCVAVLIALRQQEYRIFQQIKSLRARRSQRVLIKKGD